LRKWLQLFRAQTGFATVYTIITPYLLAGGDPGNLTWIIPLSLLTHYASFGHNSVMDYWHDVGDPHKRHHPLVSGAISLRRAHQVIHTMLVVAGALWVLATLHVSPAPHLAVSALLLYALLGHSYNDGLDKHTIHSWAPISLCYTALAAFGWFLASPRIDMLFTLLLAVSFSSIFYQIAFEGNLKEICVEESLLEELAEEVGCIRYFDGVTVIRYSGPTFWWLRVLLDTSVLTTMVVLGRSLMPLFIVVPLTTLQATLITAMNRELGEGIDRDKLLEYFGLIEAMQFFRILGLVATDLRRLALCVGLIAAGASYFYLMNRWLWGSRWGPRV
jgi:hypothetical protein